MILRTRAKDLDLARGPLLMGVLNVTPDSFFDGGRAAGVEAAIARAEVMAEEGADLIDVGGESTRPGAAPVPLEEELRRVVPVVEALAARLPNVPISVDTMKAQVARRALEAGASVVNDVSALRHDPGMVKAVKDHGVPVILMHMQGEPRTMQKDPSYKDLVEEIKTFFAQRMDWAVRQGLRPHQFVLDPGIGFGKTVEHNLEILRNVKSFLELEQPLLIGASRKSFIGRLLARQSPPEGGRAAEPLPAGERLEGTLAAHLWAAAEGAHLLRVHDVAAHRKALALWRNLQGEGRAQDRHR
jgi:dihydropteroate synthase